MPRQDSAIEALLALQIQALKLPKYERDYKAINGRKFEIDFCWPERKCGCDVDGMVHRIKDRFERDATRHNLLLFAGWRIIRVTGKMVRSGVAVQWIERLLNE